MIESSKFTRVNHNHAIDHQTNFSMITNYGKKMKEVQHQVTSLDSRLKEIDRMLCSRVDPSLRRRGGLDRTYLEPDPLSLMY